MWNSHLNDMEIPEAKRFIPKGFELGTTLRACLHEGGGPQVGEVTCGKLPHLTCKRDHVK